MKTMLRTFVVAALTFLSINQLQAFTVKGTVLSSETGKPIPGVMVNFQFISEDYGWVEPVYTGEDGVYLIDLEEGIYFVFVYHDEYQSYEQDNITVNGDLTLDFKLTTLVIEPVYDNSVSGVVLDKATNLPVAYASVTLMPYFNDPYSFNYYTDENGYFEFTNTVPGAYTLSVWQYGYENYNDTTKLHIESDTELTGLNVLLEPLEKYSNLTIRVFTLENGTKVFIPGAEIYAYTLYNSFYGQTNENGEYTFEDIYGGTYEVWVYYNGYTQTASKFEINSNNQVIEIELKKLEIGKISGRVYADSDQKPIAGTYLYAYPVESKNTNWYNYYAASDSSGNYTLELPTGKYIVTCSYLNNYNFYYSVTEYYNNAITMEDALEVIVGKDSTSIIDFGLDVTFPDLIEVTITGKITSTDGAHISYAELMVNDILNERYEYLKLEIDAEGNYSAKVMMIKGPNELTIGVLSPDYEQQFYNGINSWYGADIIKIDISETNRLIENINFNLTAYKNIPNYSLSGQVTDESNNPVAGAFVDVFGENGTSGFSVTDSVGDYIIPNLTAGKYLVGFSAEGYLPQYYNNVIEWENAQWVELNDHLKGINASLKKSQEPGFAGVITGRVTYDNYNPVVGARVILSTSEDTAITSDITNSKGEFQLKGINEAEYFITVSMVNYHSYTSSLNFNMKESKTHNYNVNLLITDVKENDGTAEKPEEFALKANYPNPFNPVTTISYDIPELTHVELKVYNIIGKEIETLVNSEQEAGVYEVRFSRNDLPSGLYIYQLKAGNFIQSRKMILMK